MSASPRSVAHPAGAARSKRSRREAVRRGLVRRGNTLPFILISSAIVAALALGGWWMFSGGAAEETPEFLTTAVSHGPYDFVVIEQGTVESATNVELRCQVRSRGGGGGGGDRGGSGLGGSSTTIMEVVPEGSVVKEGDVVVELDSSSLLLEENSQKIAVSNRESLLAQAQNTLKAAQIGKTEYLDGLYVSQEKLIQTELFIAEQNLRIYEQGLKSAKALFERNIITGLQLDAAEVAMKNAQNQLDNAQTKLVTLQNLTKQKELTVLDASIKSAEANVKAQEQSMQLEMDKLKDIQDQIAKCTIKAPQGGQVVYANETDMFRGSSSSQFVVTPGAMVRERQVIIRLPNANDMQVKATVNEAKVTLVRPGLPVTIRVDALKDDILEGEVTKVNQYAEASTFSSGNIKKYATIIKIKNPPPDLRVGMNAEVRIHVERKPDALQIPVQALAELKGHYFTLVKNGENFETREIKIGSTNDKVATIDGGLKDGDEVIMNPRSAGTMLKLPSLPDPTPALAGEIKRSDPSESPLLASAQKAGPGGAAQPGAGAQGGDGKGKRGFVSSKQILERYMEADADKDGKLSKDEIATMDDRRRQALEKADGNKDGVLDESELKLAAAEAFQNMQKMREGGGGKGGGGGGGFGGRRGGGDGGGPPGGGGAPAGGAQ
jgi:HlyD family secretion protein